MIESFLGLAFALVVLLALFGPTVALLLLRSRIRRLEVAVSSLRTGLNETQRELRSRAAWDSPASHASPHGPVAEPVPAAGPPIPKVPVIAVEGPLPAPPLRPAVVSPPPIGARPGVSVPRLQVQRPPTDEPDSLERVIGTLWLNWIGALVVLVGLAFLLKFVYDRGWIGPAGRVAIGVTVGVAFLYVGEFRLRRAYDLLSQSVSATGSGALFLTTYLAYKFYEFGGPTSTFLLLAWFAGFTLALAVVRNGRVLAFLGLLGGYLAPYLLSTGEDHAEVLFGYLGMLMVAAAIAHISRGWPGIPALCFVLSALYYFGWYAGFYRPERMIVAAIGAGGLILITGGLSLSRSLWRRRTSTIEEIGVLAASAVFGIWYLWTILREDHRVILGLALCGVSLASIVAIRLVAERGGRASPMLNLLLGLAGSSLLLIVPATLEAEGALVCWALGAALFAVIGARSGNTVIEVLAGIALVSSLWTGLAQPVSHTGIFVPVVNPVFVAWLAAVAAWFVSGVLFSRARDGGPERMVGTALKVAAVFMMLGLLTYETGAWFDARIRLETAGAEGLRDWRTIAVCLLWSTYPLLWFRPARRTPALWRLSAWIYVVMGIGYASLLSDLHRQESLAFLNPVFIAALLFPAGIFAVSLRLSAESSRMRNALQVYGHLLCAVLLAVELQQGTILASAPAAIRHWSRTALISAGWATYASVVLAAGISRNLKHWRMLALGMLAVTLLKVFFIDMAEVRQIWRVVSFLVLGLLLMACSYAYSRNERKKRLTGAESADNREVSS